MKKIVKIFVTTAFVIGALLLFILLMFAPDFKDMYYQFLSIGLVLMLIPIAYIALD